jgi:hypothetical protein
VLLIFWRARLSDCFGVPAGMLAQPNRVINALLRFVKFYSRSEIRK